MKTRSLIAVMAAAVIALSGLTASTASAHPYGSRTQPVSNIRVVEKTDKSVQLGWAPKDGVRSFKIYRNGVQVARTTNLRFAFAGLAPSRTYSLGVTAVSKRGVDSVRKSVTVTTKAKANVKAPAPKPVPAPVPAPKPAPVPAPAPVPVPAPAPAPVPAPVPVPAPAPAPVPAPIPAPAPAPAPKRSAYPWHTNVVSTTFWVGEIFNPNVPDGSQMISTYDGEWFANYGGCDGIAKTGVCATEKRTAANGYFPTSLTPKENPFYLDLPYDDLNDPIGFSQRCQVIPWAVGSSAALCKDSTHSFMKNRWVEIVGPNGATCYGQIQDAGPSSGSLYHDAGYVFGSDNARPANKLFSGDPTQGAGMDVSPALNGCLGFASLDGDRDKVDWRWVDQADVPAGPWRTIVTTSQVNW